MKKYTAVSVMRFFSTVMAILFVLSVFSGVNPQKTDAGEYVGDFCWNWSNQTPAESGTLQLGITHIGGGHYLCSGIMSVTEPISAKFPVHGNVEIISGEIYVTLSLAHRLRNNTLGSTILEAKLNPTNFNGPFEAINLFVDDVEISEGAFSYTNCK